MHGDPGDGVILRRLVTPFLALLKRNIQVVDCRRRRDLAGNGAVATQDDARRTSRLKLLASEVLRFGLDDCCFVSIGTGNRRRPPLAVHHPR